MILNTLGEMLGLLNTILPSTFFAQVDDRAVSKYSERARKLRMGFECFDIGAFTNDYLQVVVNGACLQIADVFY
jgi:hypothetical protein